MLAVRSTSTATATDTGSVTVTKPAGVAVGDLLLIVTHKTGVNTDATCSGFSVAASSYYDASGSLPDVGVTLLYRIADSTDVSASNYVVNHAGSTDSGIVAMLAITGWVSGNPVYGSSFANNTQDATSYTLTTSGLSLQRPTTSALLLLISAFYSNSSPYSTSTFGSYSVTSGVANPTWTEVIDNSTTIEAGPKVCFSLAYTITTDQSDVTAFSVTGATDVSGTADTETALFVVINEPQNATPDIQHLAIAPTIENLNVTSMTAGASIEMGSFSPTLNGLDARATTPTQWTNETKPSTTWTNQDK